MANVINNLGNMIRQASDDFFALLTGGLRRIANDAIFQYSKDTSAAVRRVALLASARLQSDARNHRTEMVDGRDPRCELIDIHSL